jgi:hypothetical protein
MFRATNILIAAGVAALLAPAAGWAQGYGQGQYGQRQDQYQGQYQGQQQGQNYGQDDRQNYGQSGPRDRDRYDPSNFPGYPEFANLEVRLQRKIQEGRREGWLTADRAQRFVDRYKDIRADEGRAYRRYGWNLPDDEREQFRERIQRLDRRIDDLRGDGRRGY